MHISDGVLTAPLLIAGGILGLAGVAVGLAGTPPRAVPKVAMVAAVFFAASLVHVPVGPVHMHLVLIGLAGLLLGRSLPPAVLVALVFQAVLFGFGGLTTLGVNTCIMSLPGIAVYYLLHGLVSGPDQRLALVAGFGAGFTAIVLAAAMLMFVLLATGQAFAATAKVVFFAHLPLALVEGLLTMFAVAFLRKVRPILLAGVAT